MPINDEILDLQNQQAKANQESATGKDAGFLQRLGLNLADSLTKQPVGSSLQNLREGAVKKQQMAQQRSNQLNERIAGLQKVKLEQDKNDPTSELSKQASAQAVQKARAMRDMMAKSSGGQINADDATLDAYYSNRSAAELEKGDSTQDVINIFKMQQEKTKLDREESEKEKDRAFRAKESALGYQRDLNKIDANKRADIEKENAKPISDAKLPLDVKTGVTTLATKNANKQSIAGQLEAFSSNFDKLPEDQKVNQGLQMLKVLNSAEGQDAVSADEAKRLGALLDFSFGFNELKQPQLGRDVKGFKKQLDDTAKNLRQAAKINQTEIDKKLGRTSSGSTGSFEAPSGLTPEQRRKEIEELKKKLN